MNGVSVQHQYNKLQSCPLPTWMHSYNRIVAHRAFFGDAVFDKHYARGIMPADTDAIRDIASMLVAVESERVKAMELDRATRRATAEQYMEAWGMAHPSV